MADVGAAGGGGVEVGMILSSAPAFGVNVIEALIVGVGCRYGVADGNGVETTVGDGSADGVIVTVRVGRGVRLGVGDGVQVGDGVIVPVGVGVSDGVGVSVGVKLGVAVGVGTNCSRPTSYVRFGPYAPLLRMVA